MKKILLILSLSISSLFATVQEITVTILPQKYFVEKIVKDKFKINVMVPPGSSPHNFEPKPSQMKALFNSKLYFTIGEPSEKVWIDKFKQNAKSTIFVDTTKGIEKIEMLEHSHDDHDHDEDNPHHEHHEHDEDALDPHIWLEPSLVKTQAKNIYESIVLADKENGDFYKTNYEEFIKELQILDESIKNILEAHKNRAFMVFHPSWGYFAKKYNLEQIAVENMGKEPKPNELVKLITEAKEHNIKIVFTSPQFSKKSSEILAKQINGTVVTIDTLSENWSENLLNTAKSIAKSYE
ncbi:metal ABC transporter solute-binding protein, Zn/Mn family [Arcobacter vandammei]|uniref:metal ABC transporter solute-binding protein, Zn/Mn family n=1 Tax=Arcobacter vandammei TaxID=2782243 RepID=UPI0018E04D3D|nr:zinc ABC transporter substrate-binding protein [Arcobacter vandammei]